LLAREKNIALRVEIADEPLCIAADADHLLRLCLILLDNAIKYTPAGGTITAVASGGVGVASLEVRDSGIGIAARDLPRIFSRFFRADEARTKGHGAGLGLSIAQWIVEAHHAKIFVSSKPGEGSTFRVEFPGISRAPEGHADPRGAVQRAV
jgi:signal transduction histidine kinase